MKNIGKLQAIAIRITITVFHLQFEPLTSKKYSVLRIGLVNKGNTQFQFAEYFGDYKRGDEMIEYLKIFRIPYEIHYEDINQKRIILISTEHFKVRRSN